MNHSITFDKKSKNTSIRIWAVVVWLLVWQTMSIWIGQEILLVSPVSVLFRLFKLVLQSSYWNSIWFSFYRITTGFLMGLIGGIIFAVLSYCFPLIRDLLTPLVSVIRSIPLASFVIVALIWISSRNLSVFISFLMVIPIIYTNILQGILCTDPKLLEMADLFEVSPLRRIRFIYLSHLLPFLRSACSTSLGLCWKAGISAEIIGIPKGSIGENLYDAKIYLNTVDLFAWTVTIILISLLFERLFMFIVDSFVNLMERT